MTASGRHVMLRVVHAYQTLTNLLYPPACLLCQTSLPAPRDSDASQARQAGLAPSAGALADGAMLCKECRGRMPRLGPPVCVRCGAGLPGAFDAAVECAVCRATPPAFETARAPWLYAGVMQEAVQQFKYHRRWRLGRWLADTMAAEARSAFPLEEVDAVLPVPPHWLKRRFQGFNAAEELAAAVARSLGKPCVPRALRRRRWTATQTRLGWQERFRNVQEAFIAPPAQVPHRNLLLVDDVLTSGATANACALALKAAGVCRVFVLTAARTALDDH